MSIFNEKTITHKYETQDEWLELRSKSTYITSTEVASIKGIGFNTPNEVFEAKVTGYKGKRAVSELLVWGEMVEHTIAEMIRKTYGLIVVPNKVFQSRGVLAASYDYQILGIDETATKLINIPSEIVAVLNKGKKINTEIKYVTDIKWNEDWVNDGLPAKYFYQTQTQMYVDGEFEDTFVFTVFNGKLHHRHVEGDAIIQEDIYEDAKEFLEKYVATKTPPPADYAKDTDVIKYRVVNNYIHDEQANVDKEIIAEYFDNKKAMSEMKKTDTRLKNEILDVSKAAGLYDGYEIKIDKRGAVSIKDKR